MVEPIKEDAWEDTREPSSDIVLVPSGGDGARPETDTLLVCYNGGSGGSVRIQTSTCTPAADPAATAAAATTAAATATAAGDSAIGDNGPA